MTAEEIQQLILKLEMALADNASSVEFDGHKIQLFGAADTERRIKYFKSKLSKLQKGCKGPTRVTVYTTARKGL